ncbi:MAG: DUF2334 domain-containing protein [Polyangiales bacterium]
MTLYLLRDDDANATTDPQRIERAYAPLLERGFALNLSVIPEVALDTRAPDGVRERFLSEDSEDCDRVIALKGENAMAKWIKAHRGQVEALVHGLSHRRVRGGTEFGSLDERSAGTRMDRGRALLEAALAEKMTGFVAPWDAMSSGSIRAAVSRFRVLSTSWLDRGRLPLRWWPAHYAERVTRCESLRLGDAWVLRHRGGPIGAELNPSDVERVVDSLAHRAEVCVIVLHHWMFWGRSEPHPVIRALASALEGKRVLRASDVAGTLDASVFAAA